MTSKKKERYGGLILGGDAQSIDIAISLHDKNIPIVFASWEHGIARFSKLKMNYFTIPPPYEKKKLSF